MATSAPDSVILLCTATVAASAAAGEIDNVNITDSPELATTTRFLIPQGQTWIFEDLYISAAGGAGVLSAPVIKIFKNGGRIMGTTPPLGDLLVSNSSRPPYANKKLLYRGGQSLSMQTIATAAGTTCGTESIAFRIRVRVI